MNKQIVESFDRIVKNKLSQKKKLVESVGKFIIMHKSGKFFWNDERAKFVKNIDDASIFRLSQEADTALFNAQELYLDRYPEAENSDNIITTTYDNALSIIDKLNYYAKGKNQGGDRKEAYQKVFDKFNISGAYPGKLEYEFDGKDGHYNTYGLKGTNNTGSRGWTGTVNFILRVTEPSGKHVFIGTAKELDTYLMNKLGESSSTVDLKESAANYDKDDDYDDEDLDESIRTRKQNSVKALKESCDEDQYEYQIFVNDEVLDDYFEDKDLAYAKAKKLKRSKYYNGEKIYKIELWRAPLGKLDGELYDVILDESYNNSKLNQLKESLGQEKFNKIQSLIKECLKEGMEVEITIPKKRK